MGYARYVGRVGALAVALGIGVALANGPATAWADGDEGPSSGSGSSTSDSSLGADSKSDTSGSAGSTGVSSDGAAGNASPGADGGTGDAAGEDADDDGSTDAAKENEESGADDAAAVDDSASDSGQPAGVRKGLRGSQRESVTPRKSEVKVRSEAVPSAKRSPAATTVSNASTTAAGGTAPQAVSVSETRRSVPISTPVRSADVVDVAAVSTATPEPAKTVTTALLSALGLSPLATGGPADAPESPVAWAMFAALRRQTDEDAGTEQKLLSVADPVARTMSVEDAAEPMMAMAAAVNAGPSASPTAGLPEVVNGTVTGSLNAVDPESNPLTYAVQSKSAGAVVTVNGAGNFTYTPSQAARLQAATTTGLVVDTDTFTVRVSDGQTFTDVPVTVTVRPGQLASGAAVDVGRDPSGVAFSVDGSLAYVTNEFDKTVSVINTSNGAVLATITVPYAPKAVVVSPVTGQNLAYVAMSTGVAVINTATNKVVDLKPSTRTVDTITVGASPSALAINPTGTRLYVSNLGGTTVSVVDTATNLEITWVTVGSQPSGLVVSPDGSRVYALSRFTNKVTVFSTANNQVIGSAAVGASPRGIVLSSDGQVGYVTNYTSGTVTVLNTTAAAPVVIKTLTVGTQPDGIAITKDGSLVYVANGRDTVSVINTATNTVIGSAVPIGGTGTSGAHAIAVSGNTIYVTDYVEDWVRVLNVARVQTAPQANGLPIVGTPDLTDAAVSGDLKVIDTDGDALSYTVTTAPARGALTVNPNGTYTYKPTDAARQQAAQPGGATTDSFTVNVTDTLNATNTVTVTVPIAPTLPPPVDPNNHAPVATPTVFSQDPLTGAVTGTVRISDADGDPLAYTMVGVPTHGTVSFNTSTGAFAYMPSQSARLAADQTAGPDTDAFTVTVSDGETTTTAVVTVPLSPAKLTQNQVAIPVGIGAAGVAFRGNYAFVANQNTGIVTVIDTTTNSVVGTVPAGAGATSVATIYNGTFAYIALKDENAVSVINTYSITGERWIPVGAQPWGIVAAPNYQTVYVTNSGGNTVTIIDTLNKNVVGAIAVGNNPMGVAISADSARLYVANKGSNTVSIVDTSSRSVVATVPVGTNPVAVALNSAGTRLYVSNLNGTVSVVNIAAPTPTVVSTVAVGPQPYSLALSPDGSLYVVNSNDTMSVIDTGTNTVVRTVTMDTQAENGLHFVALDPYGQVYVSDAFDGVVRSISVTPSAPSALAATSTAITVGANPTAVAVNGSHTYVLTTGNRAISVIDTVTGQVVKTIPLSTTAYNMVVAPDDKHIYLANYDTVSVIDTATGNEVIAPISIPNLCEDGSCWGSAGGLYDLAISPDGSRVYALRGYATMGGNFSAVSRIDTATNSVTSTNLTDWLYDIEVAGSGTLLYGAYGESYWATRPFVTVFDAITLGGPGYILVSTAEAVGSEYATGEYATAVATSPDGTRAYAIVSSSTPKYVAVVDTNPASPTYNTQIGQIAVPLGVQGVAVSPDCRRLYVSLSDGKTVEVIDTASNTVLGYFTKPSSGSMTVAFDGTLYFTDYAKGKLYAVTVGSAPPSL